MKGVGVSEHDSAEAAANCLGWRSGLWEGRFQRRAACGQPS